MNAASTGRNLFALLKAAFKKRSVDKVARLGAALAYFTVFAIAPLIVIAVSVAGLVLSEQAAEGEIVDQIAGYVGPETAAFVQDLVAGTSGGAAVGGAVFGFLLAMFAASAVTAQLVEAFNVIWDVPVSDRVGLRALIRSRAKGLVVVLLIGLVLVAVMAAGSVVAAVARFGEETPLRPLFEALTPLATVVLDGLAFALLFRYLPAARVRWRDALVGGVFTAVLFLAGAWGLSRYLGTGAVGAGFGAAAALVVLLVFVYYSAQIVLFGAEFTRVYGLARAGTAPDVVIARLTAGVDVVGVEAAGVETAGVEAAGGHSPAPAPAPAPEASRTGMPAVAAFLLGLLIGRVRRR